MCSVTYMCCQHRRLWLVLGIGFIGPLPLCPLLLWGHTKLHSMAVTFAAAIQGLSTSKLDDLLGLSLPGLTLQCLLSNAGSRWLMHHLFI